MKFWKPWAKSSDGGAFRFIGFSTICARCLKSIILLFKAFRNQIFCLSWSLVESEPLIPFLSRSDTLSHSLPPPSYGYVIKSRENPSQLKALWIDQSDDLKLAIPLTIFCWLMLFHLQRLSLIVDDSTSGGSCKILCQLNHSAHFVRIKKRHEIDLKRKMIPILGLKRDWLSNEKAKNRD